MGNTGGRRSKNVAFTEAVPRRVVVTARKQQRRHDVDEEGQTTARASRRRRPASGVPPRAGGGDGTVVTVKVVMTRRDAEALAARLDARARKARMAELVGELRAGGGGASPASCWSPQLAPIKEI